MNYSVNEKTGRPPKGYSDYQWQQDFSKIKERIHPSDQKRMKIIPERIDPDITYHGKTEYQYYCETINDILSNIRHGGIDYCYNVHQISELLKYEHDRLQARWLQDDMCFELTLE